MFAGEGGAVAAEGGEAGVLGAAVAAGGNGGGLVGGLGFVRGGLAWFQAACVLGQGEGVVPLDVLGVLRDEVLPALAVGLGLDVGVFVFAGFAFFRLLMLDEVGKRAVCGVLVAGEIEVELLFGAGEGDVEQAEVFGALFGLGLLLVVAGLGGGEFGGGFGG